MEDAQMEVHTISSDHDTITTLKHKGLNQGRIDPCFHALTPQSNCSNRNKKNWSDQLISLKQCDHSPLTSGVFPHRGEWIFSLFWTVFCKPYSLLCGKIPVSEMLRPPHPATVPHWKSLKPQVFLIPFELHLYRVYVPDALSCCHVIGWLDI